MGPMPADPEGMIMRALQPDSKLAKEIGMTDEQSVALRKLFTESQAEMKESREKMEKLALQQADLLSQDAPDEAAVIKVVEQLGELRLQFAKHRIHQLLAAQKILTPEQRTKLREQMKSRMEQLRENRKEGRGMREGGPRRGQEEGKRQTPPPPPAPEKD
jgi:Spy/CpxP family protein refolding chaperone